jgi:hypothetical protein
LKFAGIATPLFLVVAQVNILYIMGVHSHSYEPQPLPFSGTVGDLTNLPIICLKDYSLLAYTVIGAN